MEDEQSTYAEPKSPKAYERLISNECVKELHSVQESLRLWEGVRGEWCVYDYGSEAPDLYFCGKNSLDFAVFFRRPFRTMAYASGRTTTLPLFRWGLIFLQMPADVVEGQMDTAGAEIGLPPDRLADWELRTSHDDIYLFSHKHLDTKGNWTKKLHLVVKGTVVSRLSELVSLFSATDRTTLFVHACTPGIQFE